MAHGQHGAPDLSEQLLASGASRAIWRTETLGVPVFAAGTQQDLMQLIARMLQSSAPFITTFVNPGSVVHALRDPAYRRALQAFDLVLPDGTGMCIAVRKLHGLPACRASFDGTSLAPVIMFLADTYEMDLVLVGGRPGVATEAARQIGLAYPRVKIAGVLDGYGDRAAMVKELHSRDPRIVVCGMGAGQQEEFLLRLRESGWNGCGFTCGGYLDQITRGLSYYPKWIDAADLRWAYRLFREPRRLWRRYFLDYGQFGVYLGRDLAAAQIRSGLRSAVVGSFDLGGSESLVYRGSRGQQAGGIFVDTSLNGPSAAAACPVGESS
jgi:N-acetylglucosaminyldiphosphoundecaprenol N-acetyl-beta-D-mannosaminyltransferase